MPDNVRDLQIQCDWLRIEFLRNELSLGLTFARIAQSETHLGNHEHAKRSADDATKAVETLERYLSDPKHSDHIAQEKQREIATGIEKIRQVLAGGEL